MWKMICVYYYEDNKEHLLLQGVRPVLRALREGQDVKRCYVRRHWKYGPHLELYLDVEEGPFYDKVLPFVQEQIGAYLHEHPSQRALDAAQYLEQSKVLGAWELEPGPYEPLEPDNTIMERPYVRKSEVLNGENVIENIEDFLGETVEVMFDVIEDSPNNMSKRYGWMIKMMAAVAEQFPFDGIVRGHLSYRSHVEGYLNEFDKDGKIREVFAKQDEGMKDTVDALLREVVDHTGEQGLYEGEDPLLRHWSRTLKNLYDASYPLAAKGEINANTEHYLDVAKEIGEQAVERWGREVDPDDLSAFHQTMFRAANHERFFHSPEFATYRILVNSFYLLLPLFGINPNVKHFLCYLVSQSVERVKNVRWQDLIPKPAAGEEGALDSHETQV